MTHDLASTTGLHCWSCGEQAAAAQPFSVCPACRSGTLVLPKGGPRRQARALPPDREIRFGSIAPWVRSLILLVVVMSAGVLATRYVRWAFASFGSSSVEGEHASLPLGIRLEFPADWRHFPHHDAARTVPVASAVRGMWLTSPRADLGALQIRSSGYFRGNAASNLDAVFSIGQVGLTSPAMRSALHANFWAIVEGSKGAMAESVVQQIGPAAMVIGACTRVPLPSSRGSRCVGTTDASGLTDAVLYVWPTQAGFGVAVLLSRRGPEATLTEAEELIQSVRSLASSG